MKIIGKNGNSYMLETDDGEYWKFDSDYNETFKNVNKQSMMTHVPGWVDFDGGVLAEEIIKKAKEAPAIILPDIRKG